MDPKPKEEGLEPQQQDPGAAKKPAKPKTDKPAKPKKPMDPFLAEQKAIETQNKAVLEVAVKIAEKISARFVILILEDPDVFKVPEKISKLKNLVLVAPEKALGDEVKKTFKTVLSMPTLQLSRTGKIKMAVMRSLSAHLLNPGDKIVCVTGARGMTNLDSMIVLDIGKETELLSSNEIAGLSTQVRTEVFEELVTIAAEVANQGREGKPVGAIFVLGDTEKVMQLSRQLIFNPFHGYPEEERNILDPRLRDTIKEFASLDGAFIIRDDGVIMASGRFLNAAAEDANLPQGLGARHAAAAGITAVTQATAIAISESTGTVRIFRSGKIFMELEKAVSSTKK